MDHTISNLIGAIISTSGTGSHFVQRSFKWSYPAPWVFLPILATATFAWPTGPASGGSGSGVQDAPWIFQYLAKCMETITAILSVALVTFTYNILIEPGSRLTSTSLLPMESIRRNVASILTSAWPDTSDSTQCAAITELNNPPDAIRLLYVGRMRGESGANRSARGVTQCDAVPDKRLQAPNLWLTGGSSLSSSMAQLAVWECVFLWITMAMTHVTLLHNGFFTGPLTQDALLRVLVVLGYAAAYVAHAVHVWRSCITFYTNVAAGATWNILHKASFSVTEMGQLQNRISHPDQNIPLDFHTIHKASDVFTPATFTANLEHERQESPHVASTTLFTGQTQDEVVEVKNAMETVRWIQSTEGRKTAAAGQIALHCIIATGMLTLIVIISCGFFAWTGGFTVISESTGSTGLVGCLALGLACMYASAAQLDIMNSAFKEVLYLKEVIINRQVVNFVQKRGSSRRLIGFTQGTIVPWVVRVRDFVGDMWVEDAFRFLLFGPGYFLLPTIDDKTRTSTRADFEFEMAVRGHVVVLTTAGTNAHSRDGEGNNVEAINVCYLGSADVGKCN